MGRLRLHGHGTKEKQCIPTLFRAHKLCPTETSWLLTALRARCTKSTEKVKWFGNTSARLDTKDPTCRARHSPRGIEQVQRPTPFSKRPTTQSTIRHSSTAPWWEWTISSNGTTHVRNKMHGVGTGTEMVASMTGTTTASPTLTICVREETIRWTLTKTVSSMLAMNWSTTMATAWPMKTTCVRGTMMALTKTMTAFQNPVMHWLTATTTRYLIRLISARATMTCWMTIMTAYRTAVTPSWTLTEMVLEMQRTDVRAATTTRMLTVMAYRMLVMNHRHPKQRTTQPMKTSLAKRRNLFPKPRRTESLFWLNIPSRPSCWVCC